MKKYLSALLAAVMILAMCMPAFAAEKDDPFKRIITSGIGQSAAAASRKPVKIVFVNGIGQSWTYHLDGKVDKKGEHYVEVDGNSYHYDDMNNLFNFWVKGVLRHILSSPVSTLNTLNCFGDLLVTCTTPFYAMNEKQVHKLARDLLYQNITDENGKLPPEQFTPVYTCPVSELPAEGNKRFYRCVPCENVLEEYGAENAFWYCYSPFWDLKAVSDGLNDYIRNIYKTYPETETVVLVPMSMGAAITSQYLYDYGEQGDVSKIVSIVGCWQGSEVLADLIEQKWTDDSAELFYSSWDDMLEDPFLGNAMNLLFRLGKKQNLTRLIGDVLDAVCDEMVLKASALLALLPPDRYDAIRDKYLTRPGYEEVLAQTDAYHKAQTSLQSTMKKLEKQGMEFYFISGYGMDLGEGYALFGEDGSEANYTIMQMLASASKVNSDEIIPIGSTAPGATAVPAGEKLSEHYLQNADPAYISPDKSVDISTCYYPEHVWLFNKQIHQLDENRTAIRLAFAVATGQVQSSNDPAFPRFNESRYAEKWAEYAEYLTVFIAHNKDRPELAEAVEEAQILLDAYNDMAASNVNRRAEDDAKMAEIMQFCAENGLIEQKKVKLKDKLDNAKEAILKEIGETILEPISDRLYEKFGIGGIWNIFDKSLQK